MQLLLQLKITICIYSLQQLNPVRFETEEGGSVLLRNVRTYVQDDTVTTV